MLRTITVSVTVAGLLTYLPLPATAQQAMVRRIDPSATVLMHELMAAAGTADDDPALRFLMVPPAVARPEPTRSVNVKEGDLILMAAGSRVRSVDDLRKAYEAIPPGAVFKLGLRRGEERFLVSFTRTEQQSGMAMQSGTGAQVMSLQIGGDNADAIDVIPELGLVLSESEGEVAISGSLPLPHAGDIPLAEGDVITTFAGQPVTSLDQLLAAYNELEVGARLQVTVRRSGERKELELEKPQPVEVIRSAR